MRNSIDHASTAAALLFATCIFFSCRSNDLAMIGEWMEFTDYGITTDTIEFFEDGTCLIREDDSALAAKWNLLQDGRVKIELSVLGVPTVFIGPVSGDILRLEQPSGSSQWVREGSGMAERVRSAIEHAGLAREGMSHYYNQEFEAAIEALTEAAEAGNPRAQSGLAWLYATAPKPRFQDGKKAVLYAKQAIEWNDHSWTNWNILAAAYLRAGDSQRATEAGNEALRLAALLDDSEAQSSLETFMPLYKNGTRFVIDEGKLILE